MFPQSESVAQLVYRCFPKKLIFLITQIKNCVYAHHTSVLELLVRMTDSYRCTDVSAAFVGLSIST